MESFLVIIVLASGVFFARTIVVLVFVFVLVVVASAKMGCCGSAIECSSIPLVRRVGVWAEAATVAAATAPLALRERRATVFRGMRGMGSARAQRPGGAARTEICGFEESRCTA